MAVKKKKAPAANPFQEPSSTDAGQLAIILEDMRDQFRIFGEGLLGLRERMDARFDAVDARFDRMERRIAAVEAAITQHSAEIRELRAEVRLIRDELTRKADLDQLRRLEARVADLERRVAAAP
ncbi:MAG: hypothetical protein HY904_01135 [Deltaproteobacteria bacterium]|nr:hypothetical protein [Deltaproteobacteria bacterium]